MTDVARMEPRLKSYIDCPCGCGENGLARNKKNRDGTHHVRACVCKSCSGGQYAKAEKTRVAKFARRSGLYQQSGSGRRIGYDLGGVCAVEETSHAVIVKHLKLWWATVDVQRKLARIRRQTYQPWAFVASWENKPQLVVMSPDGFAALCLAASGSDMELALQLIDKAVEVTFPPCSLAGDDE